MMQGRRHPRALPDLRADAVPPTPKKRGRRRLTALEVLQAKSLFAGPRRFS